MSKITKIEGELPDGTIITYGEKDIDKIRLQEFTQITITEVVSKKEFLKLKKNPMKVYY
tara:strand:- start:381 stop:557 length:177 start_codon:yes stop_codon:yes gene_type:complete